MVNFQFGKLQYVRFSFFHARMSPEQDMPLVCPIESQLEPVIQECSIPKYPVVHIPRMEHPSPTYRKDL